MSPIDSLNLPLPTDDSGLERSVQMLEEFRARFCPGIDKSSMKEMINHGELILQDLRGASKNESQWQQLLEKKEKINKEAALCVIWAITKRTACQNDLYTHGATRIGGGGEISALHLEQFFRACGGAQFLPREQTTELVGGDAYSRISTHMKENVNQGALQWGLDLRPENFSPGKGLPSAKRTLLFARQPDGTFYMKLEEYGCPPILTKNFLRNLRENLGHLWSFIKTRFQSVSVRGSERDEGSLLPSKLSTKKEHVSPALKKEFAEVLKADSTLNGSRTFSLELAEGSRFGISKMKTILEKRRLLQNVPLEGELQKGFDRHKRALSVGYIGGIKGEEVLLPHL